MNRFFYYFLLVILTSSLHASTINLKIQYEEAQSGNKLVQAASLDYSRAVSISNDGMNKTLFAIKLSNLLKTSLTNYHQALNTHYHILDRRIPVINWDSIKEEHASTLLRNIEKMELVSSESDILEAIDIAKKLASNMRKGEFGPVFDSYRPPHMPRMMANCKMEVAAGLNITTGGVQDYSHFKKQVEDGYVPVPDAFIEEGFLHTFDLSLSSGSCDQLICLNPAYAYDPETNKLYVQIGMNSNVTADSFKRQPVNLAFVIDISGSMAATDNTERTRLDWVKEAINLALNNLTDKDTVSIVLFDSVSVVHLEPTSASQKAVISDSLKHIQPRNSTNLHAGLYDGYRLASQSYKEGYENRVLLFSDAGLNTGVTATDSILRLVSDYAAEGIGLSAIGVGENFHHDFIHKITMSKGGNAHFVHTGKDMMKFFANFDFLVSPVAYNLKVAVELVDLPATLVKTYGVPMGKNEPVHELINVRTLFFSNEGGSIILEYNL